VSKTPLWRRVLASLCLLAAFAFMIPPPRSNSDDVTSFVPLAVLVSIMFVSSRFLENGLKQETIIRTAFEIVLLLAVVWIYTMALAIY
jgi:hypothetical protein